ncbi:hypothetical protein [Nocardioides marmorisolisilvae]|uniref:LppX_LprAFG lipoprotein n=1 Tax=Nocardioides marmorisolisilvae TaxID=1542737 RepID=A0A3N0DW12_9ACTN|nr:hypothetical protein [Nocardioides marmorisolisilvae]RNL79809.1 hypothetical protein EFL95_12740 [Nocardioides marmorisolisilvae]
MHRTAALIAALALAVSGCGGASSKPADPTTPADHAQTGAQRDLLAKALAAFKRAPTGTYESEVTADGVSQPTAHETGSYRLRPAASAYERAILGIDEASGKPRVQVVRVRSTAGGTWFLQLKEWGSWTGCWLRTDLPEITKLTGVTSARGSSLPTAVTILAKATVVGSGDGMDGPHLAVDAYSALQFLGVAGSAIAGERAALSKVLVPVLLDVTANGGPSGAAVEGTQVFTALEAARAPLTSKLKAFVSKTHARVVFSDLGKAVSITAPSRAELLPQNPASTSTCAVNR